MGFRADPDYRFTINCDAARPGSCAYAYWPWNNGGLVPENVPPGWIFSPDVHYQQGDWEKGWCWAFDIPSDADSGDYFISPGIIVQVERVETATPAIIAPGRSRDDVRDALETTTHIRLSPGVHFWPDDIHLPADAMIYAVGAEIHRQVGGAVNTNRFFVPNGRFEVLGGTWINHKQYGHFSHQYPRASGIAEVYKARFVDCEVGESNAQMMIHRCHLDNSRYLPSGGHGAVDCLFTGVRGQPFLMRGGAGALLLESSFVGTPRGIIVHSGQPEGLLAMGIKMRHIRRVHFNASECILVEDSRADRCSFVNCTVTDCDGPGISLYAQNETPGRILAWNHLQHVDRQAISLIGNSGPIEGCYFNSIEATAGLFLDGQVQGNDFVNVNYLRQAIRSGNTVMSSFDYSKSDAIQGSANVADQAWENCKVVTADGYCLPLPVPEK